MDEWWDQTTPADDLFAPAKPIEDGPPSTAPTTPEAAGQAPGPDRAGNVDYAAPWAEEVDGVPTGSTARADDDSAVASTEVTESKSTVGAGGYRRTRKQQVNEGSHETTDVHEVTVGHDADAGGVSVGRETEQERRYGDRVAKKDKRRQGVAIGAHGAKVSAGSETEATVGDRTHTTGSDTSVSAGSGGIGVAHERRDKVETAEGARSTGRKVEIDGDHLALGSDREQTRKHTVKELGPDGQLHDVEKESSRGSETSVELGADGVGGEQRWTSTSEGGTKRSAGVSAGLGKDHASLGASYSIANRNRGSLKASATLGVSVETSEPRREGDRFVVVYRRAKHAGGSLGASSHGLGVGGGASESEYETGTRSFATEAEAKAWREDAVDDVQDSPDPRIAAGALALGIGESAGRGSERALSLGGSASLEGASLGVSHEKRTTHELDVRRVSASVVDVTFVDALDTGNQAEAGGLGVHVSRGASAHEHGATTVRFDLSTAEGKAGFEAYCADPTQAPRGGAEVSVETGRRHDTPDGTTIKGLGGATYDAVTSERTIEDAAGKHEEYVGGVTHDVDPTWLARLTGDEKVHSDMQLTARQEDDKAAGYTIEAHVGGGSGVYDRNKMQSLVGADERWDESKVAKARSGEWTVTADVDPEAIAALMKYDRRFQGKNLDERMRALTQWVSEKGPRALHEIEEMGPDFEWHVELEGDPNFPGRAGREAFAVRVDQYAAALDASAELSPALLPAVQKELDDLKARREAVADVKRYQDLPDALRRQELAEIDREMAKLGDLRHRTALESLKNNPGEGVEAALVRMGDPDAFAGKTPEQQELARLRDEIAVADQGIVQAERMNQEAEAALVAANARVDVDKAARANDLVDQRNRGFAAASDADRKHATRYRALDELRMSFFARTDEPTAAIPVARELLAGLNDELLDLGEASQRLSEASLAQVNLQKSGPPAPEDAYFARFEADNMEVEDYVDWDEDARGPRPPVKMALEPQAKPKVKPKRARRRRQI